jgi:hypothetical protein
VGKSKISTCDYVDPAKQPFATYIFKYRSKGELNTFEASVYNANAAQMHSSFCSSYHGAQVLCR